MSLQSERKQIDGDLEFQSVGQRRIAENPLSLLSPLHLPLSLPPVSLLSLLVLRISGCNKRQCKVDFGADSASVQPCSFTSSPTASCNPFLPFLRLHPLTPPSPPLLVPTATNSVLRLQAVPYPSRLWHCIEIPESSARSRDQTKMVVRSSKTTQPSSFSSPSFSPQKRSGGSSIGSDWQTIDSSLRTQRSRRSIDCYR